MMEPPIEAILIRSVDCFVGLSVWCVEREPHCYRHHLVLRVVPRGCACLIA